MRVVILMVTLLTLIPTYGIRESAAADGVTWGDRGRCTEVSNRRFLIRVNCNAADSVTIERGDFPFGVTFGAIGGDDEEPRRRPGRGRPNRPDCEPSYPTLCLPPTTRDTLNCPDIAERNFPVRGRDPHDFDGNEDGVGCEE